MATLTWIMTTFGPIILAALVNYMAKSQEDAQANRDAKDVGAAQTTATVNKETADAERRASDAALNASRADALDDLLLSGAKQI